MFTSYSLEANLKYSDDVASEEIHRNKPKKFVLGWGLIPLQVPANAVSSILMNASSVGQTFRGLNALQSFCNIPRSIFCHMNKNDDHYYSGAHFHAKRKKLPAVLCRNLRITDPALLKVSDRFRLTFTLVVHVYVPSTRCKI